MEKKVDKIDKCLGVDPIQWARANDKSVLTMRIMELEAELARPWWNAGNNGGLVVTGLKVTCPDGKVLSGTGKVCTHYPINHILVS